MLMGRCWDGADDPVEMSEPTPSMEGPNISAVQCSVV